MRQDLTPFPSTVIDFILSYFGCKTHTAKLKLSERRKCLCDGMVPCVTVEDNYSLRAKSLCFLEKGVLFPGCRLDYRPQNEVGTALCGDSD